MFSQSYIFKFCKAFFSLLVSFLFSFVSVLLFVAAVVVVVVVVVVITVVMCLPTYFYTGCMQEAWEGTSPFCHSCTPY